MASSTIFLLFTVVILSDCTKANPLCNDANLALLKSCTESLQSGQSILSNLERDVSQQLHECNVLDEAWSCANNNSLLSNCYGSHEWFVSRTLLYSFDYACSDGKAEVLANIDCLGQDEVMTSIKECYDHFFMDVGIGSACLDVRKIPTCIADKVENLCDSSSAATAIRRVMERGITVLVDYFTC